MNALSANPRRLLCLIGSLAVVGSAFAIWLGGTFAGHPDPRTCYNAFFVIFARDEALGLGLVAVFSFAAAVCFFRGAGRKRVPKEQPQPAGERATMLPRGNVLVALIGAGVFAIAALGTEFVCLNYPLSGDEFMADFQARIFLRGKITAEVPPQWIPAVRAVKPTFVDYFPATHSWKSAYLPVYAAMRALFLGAHLPSLLNPFLAAVTIFALYGVSRNIWPENQENALVACLLLAASAQFLLMSMTAYSMPAHLAFNTVWLWLYTRPDRRRFYLAPLIGVLAIGLHQPVVHALFVAPFLLRLVFQKRWRAVAVFGLIYLLGCATWYAWRVHYADPAGAGDASFFRLWNPRMLIIQPMDLLLVIGWSAFATPLLVGLGLVRIFRQQPILQDAALSCLLTFGFYYFFYLDQSHGWGYRYFHGTLSCLILVAVTGWEALRGKLGAVRGQKFLGASIVVSLLIALPLRCYQVETFVRPFARASALMHSAQVQIVGLNMSEAWYGADLLRNDPFLENVPVIAGGMPGWMTAGEVQTLAHAGKTRFIAPEELAALGMGTSVGKDYWPDPFRLGGPPPGAPRRQVGQPRLTPNEKSVTKQGGAG